MKTTTTKYDATTERETLARELAAWRSAGWIDSRIGFRWHRRVRRLAKVTGMTFEQVFADLAADADAIQSEE